MQSTEIPFKLLSFYSFKGGAGRTVCAYNMIPLLAKEFGATQKRPILVMDFDIDSAGLTHLLGQYSKFEESKWSSLNLVKSKGQEEKISWNSSNKSIFFNEDFYGSTEILSRKNKIDAIVNKLDLPQKVKELFISLNIRKSVLEGLEYIVNNSTNEDITASLKKAKNVTDLINSIESIVPAMGTVDISDQFNCEKNSVKFIGVKQVAYDVVLKDGAKELENIISACIANNFSAIILDSASGTQPIANVIHDLSNNIIVYCMRLTGQFREGTERRLKQIIKSSDAVNTNIFLLPVAVPNYDKETSPKLNLLYKEAFESLENMIKRITKFSKDMGGSLTIHSDFFNKGIPEVETFKWYESILEIEKNRTTQQDMAYNRFKELAKKLKDIIITNN